MLSASETTTLNGLETTMNYKPQQDKTAFYWIAFSIIAVLYCLVSELDYQDQIDKQNEEIVRLKKESEKNKQSANNYAAMVASAMNGRAIVDKTSSTGYFFDKPLIVDLK